MKTHIKLKFILMVLLFITTGCISSGPNKNVDFGQINKIDDLQGVYKNQGEASSGSSPYYLSAIIWPNDRSIDHAAIEAVEVRKRDEKTLVLKALTKGVVEKESTFVEGKDFSLNAGRIQLNREAGVAGFKGGEPLVGPYYGSVELGLDRGGHGKYRQSFAAAGLVYLFFPIAMSGTDDVRFIRIEK